MRKFGGAERRNRLLNEHWHCGKDRFNVQPKSAGEETVVIRIPRSRLAEVMALLNSAPTELI